MASTVVAESGTVAVPLDSSGDDRSPISESSKIVDVDDQDSRLVVGMLDTSTLTFS